MASTASVSNAPLKYRDRYAILIVVLLGVFMSVLDTSIVNVALPTITSDFGVDVSRSQWVAASYLIVLTSFILVFGHVSRYAGKKRLFIAGFAVFTLGSLACGLSGSIHELIFSRIVQGFGAAIALSIDMAILVQAFPPGERGRALGFLGTTIAIGSIAGPVLGGYVVDALGWQYVFLLNVPAGIALIAGGIRYLPSGDRCVRRLDMDWAGVALLVPAIVLLMLALGDMSASGGFSIVSVAFAATAAAAFAGLMYVESRSRSPLLDLSVFRVKRFAWSNLSTVINYAAFAGFNLIVPFYLQVAVGYKPSQVGQTLLVIPVAMALTAPLSGYLYDRFQTNVHSSLGILLMAISLIVLGVFASSADIAAVLACFALFGLGNGLFVSANNSVVMGSLPPDRGSTASSVVATLRNLGNAIGVSSAGALLYLELRRMGFQGTAMSADHVLLSQAIGVVFIAAGALCLGGVITSSLVRRG